jgi:predicted MPP superfamily phosphohydrolase
MLHEPDYVDDVTPAECSLQVSGHSHGGQMCLPFGRPLSLPRGARKYFGGFYPDAKVPLYVSRGVGTIGVDLRFFCPPEVTVLTLKQG